MRVIAYGVKDNEESFYEEFNKEYGYELTLSQRMLTDSNLAEINGYQALIIAPGCEMTRDKLQKCKKAGVRYILTRSAGYNHIDIEAAQDLDLKTARVPESSPHAIAELAVALAMALFRHIVYIVNRTSQGNFKSSPEMFSRELRSSTVGIIGVGRIGLSAAKLFGGLGAQALGYDSSPKENLHNILKMTDLNDLLAHSDIVSLHMPYIHGQNENFVNADFLARMKPEAILINTARGEVVDTSAVIQALKSRRLAGFAADVLKREETIFEKDMKDNDIQNIRAQELMQLYPRALITPHIGYYTENAVAAMIRASFQNLKDFIETGTSPNALN